MYFSSSVIVIFFEILLFRNCFSQFDLFEGKYQFIIFYLINFFIFKQKTKNKHFKIEKLIFFYCLKRKFTLLIEISSLKINFIFTEILIILNKFIINCITIYNN